jgi:amino acid transporter
MAGPGSADKPVGFWSAAAIGVGGMVGGGIFAVLGFAVQLAHGGVPVAFAIAGAVALVTSYSYARLSVKYPSRGGTVEFINQAFGEGIITGGLNILLWLSYVVMLSLYAYAFGSYGAVFFPAGSRTFAMHALASGVVLFLTALNVMGAKVVGEYEELVVGFKVVILLLFIGAGSFSVDFQSLSPSGWTAPLQLVSGGMVIFLAYEGFELIANTASDVNDPGRTLPRAYYSSVVFVIVLYVLVSAVTAGNLPVAKIVAAKDYALAEAAKPFLGSAGFTLVAVAALLSTASAINATLYGTSRVSYIIARDGELPELLEKKVWNKPVEGLLITSVLTLFTANVLDLNSISTIGSAGFLIIFAAVNASAFRLRNKAGVRPAVAALGVAACVGALGALVWMTATDTPWKLAVLGGMVSVSFIAEWAYRSVTGRSLKPEIKKQKPPSQAA